MNLGWFQSYVLVVCGLRVVGVLYGPRCGLGKLGTGGRWRFDHLSVCLVV